MITVQFELNRDVDVAAQEVRDKISTIRSLLPSTIDEPVVMKLDLDAQAIMWLAVTATDRDRVEITEYADKVTADAQEGMEAGLSSTPSFLINSMMLTGAQPFAAFQQQIEYCLAGGGPVELEVGADSFRSMGQPDAPVVVTEFSDFQ